MAKRGKNRHIHNAASALTVAIMLPAGISCSADYGDAAIPVEVDFGELEEAIRSGNITTPWSGGSTDTYGKAIVLLPGCTGTVVDPSWVLTAKHCQPTVGTQITSKRTVWDIKRTVDAVVSNLDPDRDITMVHVSEPFTDIPQIGIWNSSTNLVVGSTVRCYGYGAKAAGNACTSTSDCGQGEYCHTNWGFCLTPSPELRTGDFTATAISNDMFGTPMNGVGQGILPGDSGGSCRINQDVVGVTSAGNLEFGAQASIAAAKDFVSAPSRMMYTPGDFNGDGKMDVIITNASGSYWYYSTGTGTWNQAYTRLDQKLGSVMYTPGDFNGDGKTDVIITNPSGSYWYYSTGTGSWNTTAYTRTDLPLHYVQYSVADFNNDNRDDVIISNPSGSYWYYSTGTGSWNQAYTRTDLPSNLNEFLTGDFNGDSKDDVIIQNGSGSYWYYSTGTGTWNSTAYTRTDLPTGSAKFATGDFNGDGKTDMIVTTSTGSKWYYSTGTGTWNQAHTRTDLLLNDTSFAPGDFNGDGKVDFIISNASGSYWYYSTGIGTWNQAYVRNDLLRYKTLYSPADFNGDGKDDLIIWDSSGSYWYYSTGTGTWNTTAYSRSDLKK